METNRLKHFCTVAKLESLSKASELLGISNGGLHKSLKVLEEDLGITLTQPKGRGITLSPEGLLFYPKALKILETVERALSKEEVSAKDILKVGGLEVFMPFLGKFLKMENDLEGYSFELHEFTAGVLEEAIRNGLVSYGITYIPVPTDGLKFLKVSSFEMCVFGKKTNFAKLKYSEVPFVAPYSPLVMNPADIKNRDGWVEGKEPRFVKFKTNSLFTALELVDSGQACIYAPRFIQSYFKNDIGNLDVLFKKKEAKRSIYLILKERDQEDKLSKKLSKIMRRSFK